MKGVGAKGGLPAGDIRASQGTFLVLLASPVGFEPVRQMYMYIASQGTRIAILKYRYIVCDFTSPCLFL